MENVTLHCLLFLLVFGYTFVIVSGGNIVHNLPGYGVLPFTLETGYIGVGDNEEVQLFYYFVESQNNPQQDPLLLWIPAGPSCSTLGPFFFEIGPLSIDTENFVEGLPRLLTNEHTWTKGFNIIFLDGPTGVGFSYSEKAEDKKYLSDTQYAGNTYEFIQKWLKEHPTFFNHPLYLCGEGYAGNIIPLVMQKVINGNEGIKDKQIINVKGYAIGNPGTDIIIDFGSRVPFSHRTALISDAIFEEAKKSCNGKYFPPPNEEQNKPCSSVLAAINRLMCAIDPNNILRHSCTKNSDDCRTSVQTQPNFNCSAEILSEPFSPTLNKQKCPKDNQAICESWARDKNVQISLYIRQGKVAEWKYCSETVKDSYDKDVSSVVGVHRNFTKKHIRALIFSGDHDWSIPYIGTQQWIESLKLPLIKDWRAWFVNGEVAGYAMKYKQENFSLTFATVKGAGHSAAGELKAECYAMIHRWMTIDFL